LQADTPPETLIETLSILSILISRFPTHVSSPPLYFEPLPVFTPLLSHPRPAVRKRAILTLSQFVPVSSPGLFKDLLKSDVLPNLGEGASTDKQRMTVQLVAAVVRQSAGQIASVLGDIVPGILSAVQRDDDELREGCLQVGIVAFDSSDKF
jgi:cullin-associated NEDD8-dissociated protein 1